MTLEEKLHLLRNLFYDDDYSVSVGPHVNSKKTFACQVDNDFGESIIVGNGPTVEAAVDDALVDMKRYFHENPLDKFEAYATWFYRDTGMMAPGKDVPAATGERDDMKRYATWLQWMKERPNV